MQTNSAAVLVRGFVNLVVSQISVRLINFGLNLITARLLTPEAYGLASVQFHLLNTGIVFLSREGLKRGCQRVQQDESVNTRKVLALASLCIPLGACITLAACLATLWRFKLEEADAHVHVTAVAMQGVAAFIELCSGPLYVLAKVQLADGVVAVAEAAATIAKGASTLFLLKTSRIPIAIILSWAQVAYAGVATAIYMAYFTPSLYKWVLERLSGPADALCSSKQVVLGPRRPAEAARGSSEQELRRRNLKGDHVTAARTDAPDQPAPKAADESLIDARSLAICWRFLLQAGVHLLQTEGSKMVMALCQSSYNQGVYGLVTNLGSLVVRTIFFPVEEAAFRAFSRPPGKDVRGEQQQKAQILGILVRFFGLIGLLAVAFGPSYAYLLLRLVYGQRWSNTEAPTALAYYCGYITLLALNGCTEAYVNATADARQLSRSLWWQSTFSIAQVLLSFCLVWRLGAVGLILADSANMIMRIGYSWVFIKSAMPSLGIRAWSPTGASFIATATAALILGLSKAVLLEPHIAYGNVERSFARDACWHIATGCVTLVGVLSVMFLSERGLRAAAQQLVSNSKQHSA